MPFLYVLFPTAWRKPGTSQLCSSREVHHSAPLWAVGSLKNASSVSKHCASVKPAQALPQQKTSARLSDQTKVPLRFLLYRGEQTHTHTHRVRILLSHFVLSPNKEKLFYLGAVALNKVTLNWRVLQKQWIPSIYANSCPLPNTRAA